MEGNAAEEPTTVCAWCGKVTARRGAEISHGICEQCAMALLEEAGVLDGDPAPVSQQPTPKPITKPHTAAG